MIGSEQETVELKYSLYSLSPNRGQQIHFYTAAQHPRGIKIYRSFVVFFIVLHIIDIQYFFKTIVLIYLK